MQCGHRRGKEPGESGQLYAFDQTNLKADRVYEDIPLVPPTEIATDNSEILEQHGGSEGPKNRLSKGESENENAPFLADVIWLTQICC